jgi:hypothetical protein
MKYFLFQKVVKDFTTLEPVIPLGVVSVRYNDTLIGVDIQDTGEFLTQQHPECGVTEVTFEEIVSELKSCRQYHDIDEIVRTMIHNRYTLDDEIKLIKMGVEHPEYIEYQAFVNSCREIGRNMKIERGLRQ